MGSNRSQAYPENFKGTKELNEWRRWAASHGFTPMTTDKVMNIQRRFFIFACNTDNLCEDFCKPIMLDGRTTACRGCKLTVKMKRELPGNKTPRNITWRDLENFKEFYMNSPRKVSAKDELNENYRPQRRADKTINGVISAVLSFFEMKADTTKSQLWRRRFTEAKSVTKIKNVKMESYKPLKLDILMRIITEAEKNSYEDYTILQMLLYTGGRVQFYGLQLEEITWGKRNGETSEGMDLKTLGKIKTKIKGGKMISIPLHPKLQKIIKHHIKTRDYESPMLFRYGRVPINLKDFKRNAGYPWRLMKRYMDKLGIKENLHPHRIRKTVVTYGRKLGMDAKYMQAIVGHSSITTTEDIYNIVDVDDVGREWAKVDFEAAANGTGLGNPDLEQIFKALDSIPPKMPIEFRPGIEGVIIGLKSLIKTAVEGST